MGDEDGEFVGGRRLQWICLVQHRKLWKGGGNGRDRMNITSTEREHVTQAGRKKSQLLHLTGLEVRDIFEDLVDPGPINATTDDVYKVCIRKLYAHFRADGNVPYERHVFRNVVPLSGESADKFLVRLKKQARHGILARL